MENKKEKISKVLFIIGVSLPLITLLLAFLFSSKSPVKVYAESNDRYFTRLNSGYTNNYWLWLQNYQYQDFEATYSYDYITSYNGYGYYLLQVPSDNPDIKSLFFLFNSVNTLPMSNYTFNGGNLFEIGFLPTSYTTAILNNMYLPYKITLNSNEWLQFESYFFYLDLTDIPISTEGYGYLVVKCKSNLYSQLNSYYAYPNLIPTDLSTFDTSQYWYDFGYQDGYDNGRESAYDDYYQDGYYHGYNDGIRESSQSYGITDLLFSIFDTPFQVMYNLFSFTIFGTTAWTIIISLTTLLLVLWLVKRLLT